MLIAYTGHVTPGSLWAPVLDRHGIREMSNINDIPRLKGSFALDNGAFIAHTSGRAFDGESFVRAVKRCVPYSPDFIVIPDIVRGGLDSLQMSLDWIPQLRQLAPHIPLALVVQDGMEPHHIEPHLELFEILFVGGGRDWKYKTGESWVKFFNARESRPVHIGGIGSASGVRWAKSIGATSIDSTGPLWSQPAMKRWLDALKEPATQGAKPPSGRQRRASVGAVLPFRIAEQSRNPTVAQLRAMRYFSPKTFAKFGALWDLLLLEDPRFSDELTYKEASAIVEQEFFDYPTYCALLADILVGMYAPFGAERKKLLYRVVKVLRGETNLDPDLPGVIAELRDRASRAERFDTDYNEFLEDLDDAMLFAQEGQRSRTPGENGLLWYAMTRNKTRESIRRLIGNYIERTQGDVVGARQIEASPYTQYTRVIPRDLFNEANLLKCYGKLWIALESRRYDATLSDDDLPRETPFHIVQSQDDGSLTIDNLAFKIKGELYRLWRPSNSRDPWPLYFSSMDDEICERVFSDDGSLSPEFKRLTERADKVGAQRNFLIASLPRDMREELFNLHATSVNLEASEKAFYRLRVPLIEVDISKVRVDRSNLDRYQEPRSLPPIVVADGKLIDGGHRVAAAQKLGIKSLLAIDLSGLLSPDDTGFIDTVGARRHGRIEHPSQTSLDRELNATLTSELTLPPEEIRRIAKMDPLRALLNANCPPDLWWELAEQYPREAEKSLGFGLQTLDNPGRWQRIVDPEMLRKRANDEPLQVLSNPLCPPDLWLGLARSYPIEARASQAWLTIAKPRMSEWFKVTSRAGTAREIVTTLTRQGRYDFRPWFGKRDQLSFNRLRGKIKAKYGEEEANKYPLYVVRWENGLWEVVGLDYEEYVDNLLYVGPAFVESLRNYFLNAPSAFKLQELKPIVDLLRTRDRDLAPIAPYTLWKLLAQISDEASQ